MKLRLAERGIEARVRSAYRIAWLLYGAGVVLSQVRGTNLPVAAAPVGALVHLLVSERAFPSSGTEASPRASRAAVAASVTILLFALARAFANRAPTR